jgi:hypothetical protein
MEVAKKLEAVKAIPKGRMGNLMGMLLGTGLYGVGLNKLINNTGQQALDAKTQAAQDYVNRLKAGL